MVGSLCLFEIVKESGTFLAAAATQLRGWERGLTERGLDGTGTNNAKILNTNNIRHSED